MQSWPKYCVMNSIPQIYMIITVSLKVLAAFLRVCWRILGLPWKRGQQTLRDFVTDYRVNRSLYPRVLQYSGRLFFDLIYPFAFRFSNIPFLKSVELHFTFTSIIIESYKWRLTMWTSSACSGRGKEALLNVGLHTERGISWMITFEK
jgi:hypothetical protein